MFHIRRRQPITLLDSMLRTMPCPMARGTTNLLCPRTRHSTVQRRARRQPAPHQLRSSIRLPWSSSAFFIVFVFPPTHVAHSPALTTLNGTSSHSYSQPSNFNRQSTFQNSFSMHYQPPSAPATQGTLSPHSLHAPSPTSSSSLMAAIPAQFYSIPTQQQQRPPPPPPETPTISPQERKQQLVAAIKPLLLASAFTGAQAVQTLVQRINDHGPQDVDNATRLEIVTKIRDGAGNPYFRAWAENSTAMDITREWLKAAATATTDDPLVETVMPLLHVCTVPLSHLMSDPRYSDHRSITTKSRQPQSVQARQDCRQTGQGSTHTR